MKPTADKSSAYQSGMRAGAWGYLPKSNPFTPGSKQYHAWDRGCMYMLMKPPKRVSAAAGCPFCGGTKAHFVYQNISSNQNDKGVGSRQVVECDHCGARGGPRKTKLAAQKTWRMRNTEDGKDRLIRDMIAFLKRDNYFQASERFRKRARRLWVPGTGEGS